MKSEALIQNYKPSSSPWGRIGGAFILLLCFCQMVGAQDFCFVELNCENLFDTRHDTLKNDTEYTPEGEHHWTRSRYRRKLNNIAREIIACGGEGENWRKPDLVALVEVENDSVLHDLAKRSMLRKAGYGYVMTESPDQRGIDVALLYDANCITINKHYGIRITPPSGGKPTRDILYAECSTPKGTMNVFVVHAPSRAGGKTSTDGYRMIVARRLCESIDSIRQDDSEANIIVAGDFNDYHNDPAPLEVVRHGMKNVSANAKGMNGAQGTYRFRGEWGSLDQIFMSEPLLNRCENVSCIIFDALFLTEEETKYGGRRPHRSFRGPVFDKEGFSDHLPLVLKWK